MAKKPHVLSPAERETHISQSADERSAGFWHVYSDDPYWIKRFDNSVMAGGATLLKQHSTGGREYKLPIGQLTVRMNSRKLRHKGMFEKGENSKV